MPQAEVKKAIDKCERCGHPIETNAEEFDMPALAAGYFMHPVEACFSNLKADHDQALAIIRWADENGMVFVGPGWPPDNATQFLIFPECGGWTDVPIVKKAREAKP